MIYIILKAFCILCNLRLILVFIDHSEHVWCKAIRIGFNRRILLLFQSNVILIKNFILKDLDFIECQKCIAFQIIQCYLFYAFLNRIQIIAKILWMKWTMKRENYLYINICALISLSFYLFTVAPFVLHIFVVLL